MLTVSELIKKTDFDAIMQEYQKHYRIEHKDRVKTVFEILKAAPIARNHTNMTLFIRVIKENEHGEDVVIKTSFDCNDTSLFFDVCGEDTTYDGLWSIASSPYPELMGYLLAEETTAKFSVPQICAHILWALDW